ncbi:hypothetical protein [Priestia aryabhattai]
MSTRVLKITLKILLIIVIIIAALVKVGVTFLNYKNTHYYGKVDTDHIGIGNHSQGGIGAIMIIIFTVAKKPLRLS